MRFELDVHMHCCAGSESQPASGMWSDDSWMTTEWSEQSNRRDFLIGRALRAQVGRAGAELADAIVEDDAERVAPSGGSTIRLAARAMACDFAVVMNPGLRQQLRMASDALDRLPRLEQMMTVYRDDSEMSRINRQAPEGPSEVSRELFDLLRRACELADATGQAFDPTAGPLIDLWRACRVEDRIPKADEIQQRREIVGTHLVDLDLQRQQIAFQRPGVELNLGGIGKGYALDQMAAQLDDEHLDAYLLHGGYSSILARGEHCGQPGWPVGLRNPLFTRQRFATVLLQNQAMSTSGSNIQYFRHGGRRYGHILDPRTGQPAEALLSCSVIAPTAELADALSTAFFVLGVEKTREYCDNHRDVGALLIPPPRRGRRLEPILIGIPDEAIFLTTDDVLPE